MTHRRREALRQLAERPGTPEEGRVAREKLLEFDRKYPEFRSRSGDGWDIYASVPEFFRCPCGGKVYPGEHCDSPSNHERIRQEVKDKFPRGTRVFYNYWAYGVNSEGTVIGYPTTRDKHYGQIWGWIRIKFDHLKSARSVPIYSAKGWHLSTEPLDVAEAERMKAA